MWNIGFLLIWTISIIIIHPLNPKLKEYKQRVIEIHPKSLRVVKIKFLLEKYYYYYHQNIQIVKKISLKIGKIIIFDEFVKENCSENNNFVGEILLLLPSKYSDCWENIIKDRGRS